MSQTLQNQILLAKSMNGIVSLSDGAGTTITGGQVITNDFSGNTITVNSFSTGTMDLNNSLTLEQYDNISTGVGLVSLWVKGKSYFTYLPQSLATPSNTSDLITLLFGNANYGRLGSTNTWTGSNNFITKALFDNSTLVSTTAFVQSAINRLLYKDSLNNFGFNTTQYTSPPAGGGNFAIGNNCLQNVSGGYNTAVGTNSLRDCTTGTNNFALGANSMYALTTGGYNVAIGVFCLANTNGGGNIGMGWLTGQSSNGNYNVYIGNFCANTAGSDGNNTGIGCQAFPNLNGGHNNVAVGFNAGAGLTSGPNNSCFGYNSSLGTGTLTYATAIGSDAQATTSNSVYLGRSTDMTYAVGGLTVKTGGLTASATQTITFGTNAPTMSGANIGSGTIPDGALSSNQATLTGTQTFSGAKTFTGGITASGTQTITFGTNAPTMSGANIGSATIPDAALSSNVGLLTGIQTFSGAKTFSSLTASNPIKIIPASGISQITDSSGTNILKYDYTLAGIGIGTNALTALSGASAYSNVAVGSGALSTATVCRYCVAIGSDALKVFNGLAASNSANTAIGNVSMNAATTAAACTAIGGSTASFLTTAQNCTFLGYATDFASSTQYNTSTAIGYNAKITAANQIMMGTATETVNIPGSLTVASSLTIGTQAQNKANSTVISGTTSFSTGLTNSAYSITPAGATAFTITLPTITAANVGQEVLFRRVSATNSTTVVSFIGDGTQFVYNSTITGGAGAQALMGSGVYIVKLVSLYATSTVFAWFQV